MLAEVYHKQENLQQAISFCKEAVNVQANMFGKNHPHYARVLLHLARLHIIANNHTKAVEILQKIVGIEEETLGEENIRYKNNLELLARIAFSNKDYAISLQCWEKLYAMNFEQTDQQRFLSAKIELWLASCYIYLGDGVKAKAYYEKAMEKKQSCAIEEDDEWKNMTKGFLLIAAKKESEKLQREMKRKQQNKKQENKKSPEQEEKELLYLYEQKKDTLGEKDNQTLEIAVGLGDFYAQRGNYQKAFEWLEKAEKLTEDNTLYAQTMRKSAVLYLLSGNYEKAFQKLSHAVKFQEEYGDVNAEEYCMLLGLMGDLFFSVQNIAQAFVYYERWKMAFEKKNAKNQMYFERVQRMGDILEKLKKKQQASVYYKEVIEYMKQSRQSGLPLAKLLLKTGEILLKQDNQSQEAENMLNEAVEIFAQIRGKESKAYGRLMSKLGSLYISLKKQQQGILFLQRAYQLQCIYEDGKILSKKGYETLLKYFKENKDTQKYQMMKKGKPFPEIQ